MKDDYSRPKRAPFPQSLAEMIARKATAMAQKLEDEAMRTMVRQAQRALDDGGTAAQIAHELQLR